MPKKFKPSHGFSFALRRVCSVLLPSWRLSRPPREIPTWEEAPAFSKASAAHLSKAVSWPGRKGFLQGAAVFVKGSSQNDLSADESLAKRPQQGSLQLELNFQN